MPGSGLGTLDFGAFPGGSDATLDVSAPGVVAGSHVEAWIQPALTADHTADEHMVETLKVHGYYLSNDNIRIRGFNTSQLNEPVLPDQYNGQMLQAGATAVAWRNATSPGGTNRGGGRGTRIYGAWNIGWAWA